MSHQNTIAAAPLELGGDWGQMLPASVVRVLELSRSACLRDLALRSDRQPHMIRVDQRPSGPPAIWLHRGEPATARIFVHVGEREWCRLAYQFGHELGHVLANSWQADAVPHPPSQWLEEALVEAFSLRGLVLLAESWRTQPPFINDHGFASKISDYVDTIISNHRDLGHGNGLALGSSAAWLRSNREALEARPFLSDFAKVAAVVFLEEIEQDCTSLESLGALNRWPGRSALELSDYLDAWSASCVEIGVNASLPARIRHLMGPVQ